MLKFKVLGVFLALLYSFFSYTISYKDDYSVKKDVFIESQIRKLDPESRDIVRSDLKLQERFNINVSQNQLSLGSFKTAIPVVAEKNSKESIVKNKKDLFYKSLATERYRVLRN